jgi:CelD/BcsL family acetyltransferase involved in cellulose biosynthesis
VSTGRLSGALLHPLTDERWGAFADQAPGATIFHHSAWLRLIHERYHFPLAACVVLDGSGTVKAGFPVALVRNPLAGPRLVAFPFSDSCPPLGAPADVQALGPVADELRRRMKLSMEIRGSLPGAPGARPGARYCNHTVALSRSVEEVQRGFRRSSVMRGVRRARREGLVAERRLDTEALDNFFRLHLATRSRLGAPTQPHRFIRDLERLFAQNLGFVLQVTHGVDVVAAAVFLHHGGVLTYKYGASDERALAMRPNNLLFWEAIRWGCENGMRSLDLGRSEVTQASLREFKRSWGADEQESVYTHLGTDDPRDSDRGVVGRVLAAGLRRAPPIASRVAGEILYRYAG